MDHARGHHRHNVPDARTLRTRQTQAEARLWSILRDRRLAGLKFRRQHPIGAFVVDFCCPDRRLIVELDGGIHEHQAEEDAARQAILDAAGYRVLRIRNEALDDDLAAVLAQIHATLRDLAPVAPSHRNRTGGL